MGIPTMKFTSFQKATFVGRDKSQIFAPFCVDALPNTRKLHVCVIKQAWIDIFEYNFAFSKGKYICIITIHFTIWALGEERRGRGALFS